MLKKYADKWVKALRSGKYKQGKGNLRNSDDTYCCLGVLCDIVDNTKWNKDKFGSVSYKIGKYSETAGAPEKVMKLTGLQDALGTNFKDNDCLAYMNDRNVSFRLIANYIEKNYKKI